MLPASTSLTCHGAAGSASAAGAHACAEAVEAAIVALGGDPGVVLIFPSGIEPEVAAEEAAAAARGACVAGMTGTGAIGASGILERGCAAIAFAPSLPVGVGTAVPGDARTAGRDATATALAGIDGAPHALVLLLVDSDWGDQAEIVAGAYEAAGRTIPLAGGAAGGSARARFADGRALSDDIVAVAIGSSNPVGVGIAHGCVPCGAPSIVTRSSGRNVLQLDGRPARDVYFEKVGVLGPEVDDEAFEVLAMVHPLAQPELSGAVWPRYVRAGTPDGGLVCATSIEPNAAVAVCEQTPQTIVDSARAAAVEAAAQLQAPADAAVVFNCAGRHAGFDGDLAQRELDALVGALGSPAPAVCGVYTRGEIGRVRGAKGDRNHSVVVAAFSTSN